MIIIINHIFECLCNVVWFCVDEIVCIHWHIRKTYQTSLYRFNSYHDYILWKRRLIKLNFKLEFNRLKIFTFIKHFKFLKIFIIILNIKIINFWYNSCWFGWCYLTYYLYYNYQIRDLGPSHEIYDYNPEANMGIYKTIGPWLLSAWFLWTLVANSVFTTSIYFILNKYFLIRYTWNYWYELTICSCIEMFLMNAIISFYDTFSFILVNYIDLIKLTFDNYCYNLNLNFLKFSQSFITLESKSMFLWFPWQSFFTYWTLLSIIYILTLLSIYNTDNTYYVVLYMIFLIFLFASTLVLLDLDIFAGLLLLIESVVILMLFFLIIYLTPNISFAQKFNKWKLYSILFIISVVLSIFTYINLSESSFYPFSITTPFLDDFYEALNDLYVSDLAGIFISLYWTNSILLVIIGLLLLVASIICVVLVSYFTKLRNFNFKNFLDIFEIAKTCYSFIFLRKQNLAKQGRTVASTRIFKKKTLDTTLHTEYKEKQDIFEKKKDNNDIK